MKTRVLPLLATGIMMATTHTHARFTPGEDFDWTYQYVQKRVLAPYTWDEQNFQIRKGDNPADITMYLEPAGGWLIKKTELVAWNPNVLWVHKIKRPELHTYEAFSGKAYKNPALYNYHEYNLIEAIIYPIRPGGKGPGTPIEAPSAAGAPSIDIRWITEPGSDARVIKEKDEERIPRYFRLPTPDNPVTQTNYFKVYRMRPTKEEIKALPFPVPERDCNIRTLKWDMDVLHVCEVKTPEKIEDSPYQIADEREGEEVEFLCFLNLEKLGEAASVQTMMNSIMTAPGTPPLLNFDNIPDKYLTTIVETIGPDSQPYDSVMTGISPIADFVNGQEWGFDNYSNWAPPLGMQKETDYYGAKEGRCKLPYISVEEGKPASSELKVKNLLKDKELDVKKKYGDIKGKPDNFPIKTKGGAINFDVAEMQKGDAPKPIAELTAEFDETPDMNPLARLEVVRYTEQVRTVLVVRVNNATANADLSGASEIFKQCVTKFIPLGEVRVFDYNDVPQFTWKDNDITKLRKEVEKHFQNEINSCHHIILLLPKQHDDGAYGSAQQKGKFISLFSFPLNQADASTLAHEFGHNFNLEHTIPDTYNLMADKKNRKDRLRFFQWGKINDQSKQ